MQNNFKIKQIKCTEKVLSEIGFDKSYLKNAIDKHKFKTFRIYNLNCAQANILKQTALSVGTDCAVHREVITGKIETSDCIISGSISQFKKIFQRLKYQPFKLNILAEQINSYISETLSPLLIRDILIDWSKRTYFMGILNITPDSFSDGGKYLELDKAIEQYNNLVNNGADIIDIGGESTRPYSLKTDIDEEIKRIIPVIKAIRKFDQNTVLSVDTRNSKTALAAIDAGVDIINDVSALDWDKNMLDVLKETSAPVILNHSSASPDVMQNKTDYSDVVSTVYDYLYEKVSFLEENDISLSKIIIDPGLGFGKTTAQNYEIISRLQEFKTLNCPVLVGHSRKNFLKETIKSDDINDLDEATLILSEKLISKDANILRVHNMKKHSILSKLQNSLS